MPTKQKLMINGLAIGMLALMGALMFLSIKDDAIIIDEDPHIGAGYSYLTKGDYRLNPEHPPLMKDLGALPLTFMGLKEPWDHKSWVGDINGQWEFGRALIFGNGNDANAITEAVKKPMIVFTLLLGLAVFFWAKKEFGDGAALLATFLYAFSPTFLAHGRFVTTDVGASAGFFIGTIAFLRFLKRPSALNVLLAGLALGFAFLVKFSTFLLLPMFFLVLLVWIFANRKHAVTEESDHAHMPFSARGEEHAKEYDANDAKNYAGFWPMLFKFIAIVIIGYLAVYPLYWHHTRNYPPERQRTDTATLLSSYSIGAMRGIADLMVQKNIYPQYASRVRNFPQNVVIWASDKPAWKPFSEYFLGLLMVFQRVAGGNTTYFLGEVSKQGSLWYFPVVYALKEPVTLHILTLVALVFALLSIRSISKGREWLKEHITHIALFVVIGVYWWASVRSILNIGVRHVLPTFPFIYLLVSDRITDLYRRLMDKKLVIWGIRLLIGSFLLWQAVSVVSVHPYYLAYFNEIAGGPDGGAWYVTDSNLDWGQDLKRLSQFVDQRGIQEIWVDYFGWADPYYYLGDKRKWLSSGDGPKKGWVAVSASFYQGSRQDPEHDYRLWLTPDKLVTVIGHSIYVYYIP